MFTKHETCWIYFPFFLAIKIRIDCKHVGKLVLRSVSNMASEWKETRIRCNVSFGSLTQERATWYIQRCLVRMEWIFPVRWTPLWSTGTVVHAMGMPFTFHSMADEPSKLICLLNINERYCLCDSTPENRSQVYRTSVRYYYYYYRIINSRPNR